MPTPKPVSKTWFEIQDEKIDAKLNKIIGQLEDLQAIVARLEALPPASEACWPLQPTAFTSRIRSQRPR